MSYCAVIHAYGATFDVDFDYSTGRPGKMYMPNGDPGYPDEPAEVVINKISIDGEELTDLLSEGVIRRIEEVCYEKGDELVAEARMEAMEGRCRDYD